MTTITIHVRDWGAELRSIPIRDHEALVKAAQLTTAIDAHRWIQWSIRGGGIGGAPVDSGPERSRPKPKRKRGKKTTAWGSILSKLKKFIGKHYGTRPKVKKPRLKGKRKGGRRQAPAYRVPIDRGDYASAWVSLKLPDGSAFYNVSNPRVKAGVIEFGRRPGKGVPLEPLADWVQRKLGVSDAKKARSIAYTISKKHKEEGRKGLYVLQRARPKIIEASKKNAVRLMKKAHTAAGRVYTKRYKGK